MRFFFNSIFTVNIFCFINYNIYYEFSDFCFCVSCYSFIYLLKLDIMYYYTTLGISLLICSVYII